MKSNSSIENTTLLNQLPIDEEDATLLPQKNNSSEIKNSFTVVAIGASAGGLEAITQLLQNLSPTTGMAFIYVQHLSPDHKSMLSSILSKTTQMQVQDIDDMEKLIPNNVYVIPYDKGIEVTDGHIKLIPRGGKGSAISIDTLFSSLAETHKEDVIGIILSGSAHDGTVGLRDIKLAGGVTFAQDDSAKFSSMPNSAIAEGIVDYIMSPKEIGIELSRISLNPSEIREKIKKTFPFDFDNNNPDLKRIVQYLHKKKDVDFSHYKMNTINRRILRRMLINKLQTLKQYAELLNKDANEADLLYQDLLINVTSFFRDIDAFLLLKSTVLPKLLKSKESGETLRIWVAACATGEEVYSIAMLLLEIKEEEKLDVPFQIFASDLSTEAISIARVGEYSTSQVSSISPERMQRFFTKSKSKYRISKSLRDVCVFAHHNILRDPPFSRIDFISCRNMLIYLDIPAQKKVMCTFHYALNDSGCLMLGKSETIGASAQLFTAIDKKYKFYSRKNNTALRSIPNLSSRNSYITMTDKNSNPNLPPFKKTPLSTKGNLGQAFDAVLLEQHVPASVIINHDLDILQFRGNTALYLQHSSGKASFNILKMVHLEITFELRNAIHHAIKTKQPVRKMGIEMNRDSKDNSIQIVNIEVIPLTLEGEEPLLIVIFTGQQEIVSDEDPKKARQKSSIAKDRRIKKLEEELSCARADMGSITHDQEAANEELQSANEEIVSSNEELQSLNEELETSKEEIESTNEELTTSNLELQARIQQVEELNNYNEAILSTVHEPVLVLDKDFKIKSANKSFYKTFKVTEAESIGKSLFKLGNNQWNIHVLRELLEEIVPKNNSFFDFEVEHVFPSIGPKTMLLNAHRIVQPSLNEELIVLTIVDITEVRLLAIELQIKEKKDLEKQLEVEKKAHKLIEDSNKRYNMMLMQSPFAFAILKGKDMKIKLANDSIKEIWGKGNAVEGKPLLEVLPELIDGKIPKILDEVYKTGIHFEGYEVLIPMMRNGKLSDAYFNFVYQPYLEADESISGITIIALEVTDHHNVKVELIASKCIAEHKTLMAEEALKFKQQFLSNMSHEIRTPMNSIVGFTNLILKTELNQNQKEFIYAIKKSGESLIILINDILDIAKVDAGKMSFQNNPFSLEESVSDIFKLLEPKCQEKNLEFTKDYDASIPKTLLGDAVRLRQIILNLISNAIKFTHKGKVSINISIVNEDAKKITIEFAVIDTGIGINENRLCHIFNNFEQASDEISKEYGGTGLGLSIVKQLVEHQGGSVFVKSKLGKGSAFSFLMDFAKTADIIPQETALILNAENNGRIIKVLVAEDIALNQMLIKLILADFDFECDIAENGKIVLEKLQEKEYDIILMDLQMPVMNGFEATDYIRNILNLQIPIIALTADVTSLDIKKSKKTGMNDYISKPIDEDILYSKIMEQVHKN
ncbi:CheR family methyltransferase [Flavobacterium cellulosilyticum]|uniref:histidine kinase n=1 Tax=Flavobacterium cellulosilyticum TaxID=2541731 RepID=A0A4R5CIR3_9FLAO|nr:CheR family methyltransferase [Flavobacterium cellulosilyticum]TDD98450.1 response regulator [Flavobacterium cellulosilyticum]